MNPPYTRQSKWALLSALLLITSFANAQNTIGFTKATAYAAIQPVNKFESYSSSQAEYLGSLKYSYGSRKFRSDHKRVWGYVGLSGLGVGLVAFAVSDPGDFAVAIVNGLAGSNTPPTSSNPVKPSYLTNSQYDMWNLIMIGGIALGTIGAVIDYSQHRYALAEKTGYMEALCYTKQGYARFHVAGSGNQIGLGISLY